METNVLEAMQQGSRISEMIRVIESAWNMHDQTNNEYEVLNFHYCKLMDKIHEHVITVLVC